MLNHIIILILLHNVDYNEYTFGGIILQFICEHNILKYHCELYKNGPPFA